MSRIVMKLLAVAAATAIAACADRTPTAPAGGTTSEEDGNGGATIAIRALDDCEPATFNATVGEGTCVKNGPTTFEAFVAELTATHVAHQWRFEPSAVAAHEGDRLLVTNVGGEEHTFTEVEAFGGGIIPLLNTLAGYEHVAPECLALQPGDFIPSGGSTTETIGEDDASATGESGSEVERYQCCIHPWMHATVVVKP